MKVIREDGNNVYQSGNNDLSAFVDKDTGLLKFKDYDGNEESSIFVTPNNINLPRTIQAQANRYLISITDAIEGASIPDADQEEYTKTIPIQGNPDALLIVLQNTNSNVVSPQVLTSIDNYRDFGVSKIPLKSSATDPSAESIVRFIATKDFNQAEAGFAFNGALANPEGGSFTVRNNLSYRDDGWIGLGYNAVSNRFIGYSDDSFQPQNHSTLKTIYIEGNNLVMKWYKQLATSGINWEELTFYVYNLY